MSQAHTPRAVLRSLPPQQRRAHAACMTWMWSHTANNKLHRSSLPIVRQQKKRKETTTVNDHSQSTQKESGAPAERGHAADILPDGDCMWEHVMDHVVHEHEVHACICVRAHAKVLVVVARERHLEAMVMVHHTGHSVKAEAVELELIKPVARVAHEEPEGLPVAVVKAPRVPHPAHSGGAVRYKGPCICYCTTKKGKREYQPLKKDYAGNHKPSTSLPSLAMLKDTDSVGNGACTSPA